MIKDLLNLSEHASQPREGQEYTGQPKDAYGLVSQLKDVSAIASQRKDVSENASQPKDVLEYVSWQKDIYQEKNIRERLLVIDDLEKNVATNEQNIEKFMQRSEENKRKNWLLSKRLVQGTAWIELGIFFCLLALLLLFHNQKVTNKQIEHL